MTRKSIILFMSFLLSCGLTMPTTACPPPDCPDCYYWDGDSCEPCSQCYKCVDGDCVPCKCWDTGSPISGSITVQNAKLCEQKTHTSSVSDTDHWFLGGDGHGYPGDSLTYSWTASAGTPSTASTANFTWRAPPCVQQVNIMLYVDDVPNSMDNPCPGSSRDDAPTYFQGSSIVSLPDGCYEGTKSASLQSQIVGTTPTCPEGTCGATDILGVSAGIEAKYSGGPSYCKWGFQVMVVADVVSGACPSNYCDIIDGNEPCINENNYCGIVYRFMYMDGCVTLGDFIPSSTPCVEIHEAKHYEIFETEFSEKESWLLARPSMSDMTIDCADPNTTSCQAAKAARQSAIEGDIETALNDAWAVASDEELPIAAASICFWSIADKICTHAYRSGWKNCAYCPN